MGKALFFLVPNFSGSDDISSFRCTVSKHCHNCKSEKHSCGSRFSLIVLQNKIPSSCGIIESLDRSSVKRTFDMSMLSISIWPLAISTTPNNELANDDFPLPLLPQMPIYVQLIMNEWEKWEKLTFSNNVWRIERMNECMVQWMSER